MRVSLKWLSEYVDLRLPPEELAERLTAAGLAVDAIEHTGGDWGDEVRVGHVLTVDPHPNADRLRLVTVDAGDDAQHRVVCGAPNVAAGQKIAFGSVGTRFRDGHSGKQGVLKAAVIRGVESAGMVMSEYELGLSDEHEGILELPGDAPVGKRLADYLGDTVFVLSVTPNRPDWLSILGVAREVAALTGAELREPSTEFAAEGPPIKGRAAVDISAADLCPRYIAHVVQGIKIGPSPQWLQERLTAVGQRPINNVVDVTNYVMLEMGQPLHAFDYDRIENHHIIVRRAGQGEDFTTLDGIERKLNRDMLVIADEGAPVALAGVIGGLESEVTDATLNVLLESANFAPGSIRRTSSLLKVRSEASTRFEKGLSPVLALEAAKRAMKLFVEVCGGVAAAGEIDVYPGKEKEIRVEVTRERIEQVLGIDPPASKVRSALGGLGFAARWVPPDRYVVRVPYWRTDVRIDDDVVEEIARMIGFDELPIEPLAGRIPEPIPQPMRDLRERVKSILSAAGMQEVVTYALTTIEALQRVTPKEDLAIYPPYRVVNPVSAEYEYLRTTLRASLLQTVASNVRFEKGEIAIFEAARTYQRPGERESTNDAKRGQQPDEFEHITGAITGLKFDRWGRPGNEALDFFDAKSYVQHLFGALQVPDVQYLAADEYAFAPGRTAEIRSGDRRLGVLGQVHPEVAASFEIDQDVYLFDIALGDVLPLAGGPPQMREVIRYPAVEHDLALIVDEDVAAGAIERAIASSALVQSAVAFDVYRGGQVAPGKKSIAFAVTYQATDHTLTDEEVAKAQRKIVERLRREFGAELRGG